MAKVVIEHKKDIKRRLIMIALYAIISYGFASLAIDRGNWLWYALCFAAAYMALRNAISIIKK